MNEYTYIYIIIIRMTKIFSLCQGCPLNVRPLFFEVVLNVFYVLIFKMSLLLWVFFRLTQKFSKILFKKVLKIQILFGINGMELGSINVSSSVKKLRLRNKLKFSNSNIFASWWCKRWIIWFIGLQRYRA